MSDIIFPISINEEETPVVYKPVIQDPLYEDVDLDLDQDDDDDSTSDSDSVPSSYESVFTLGNNYTFTPLSYEDEMIPRSDAYADTDSHFYSKIQNRLYTTAPRTTAEVPKQNYNFANVAQDNYKLWLSTV